MLAAVVTGEFVGGLVVGSLLGHLLAPLLRSWLAWRERVEAFREAPPSRR